MEWNVCFAVGIRLAGKSRSQAHLSAGLGRAVPEAAVKGTLIYHDGLGTMTELPVVARCAGTLLSLWRTVLMVYTRHTCKPWSLYFSNQELVV